MTKIPKPPKPIMPEWHLMQPVPTSHDGFFTTTFDKDGRSGLWGWDEFVQECNWCMKSQFPGTHEARSMKFLLDVQTNSTQGLWQVQDAPVADAQQKASINAGCSTARMMGCGLTSWGPAYHDPITTPPTGYQVLVGGAFANNNYSGGIVVWQGVTSDEVLGVCRSVMDAFIRAGGIVE